MTCPECGSQSHEVLRSTPQHSTIRCTDCGAVSTVAAPRERTLQLPVLYSEGERSWRDVLEVGVGEAVGVGDEFEDAGHRHLVTGIERRDGVNADRAPVRELRQIAAKRFDQVRLRLTINEGDQTRSGEVLLDPDAAVQVGEVLEADGRLVRVKAFKSDQNRTVRRGFLRARNIVRAFCEPAPDGAQAGEVIPRRH